MTDFKLGRSGNKSGERLARRRADSSCNASQSPHYLVGCILVNYVPITALNAVKLTLCRADCPKEDVEITGVERGAYVDEITQLRCSADAHPEPSYMWTSELDNITVEGDTFTVVPGKNYKLMCTVTANVTSANGMVQTCSPQYGPFELNGTLLIRV